jgi:hypothetical protein
MQNPRRWKCGKKEEINTNKNTTVYEYVKFRMFVLEINYEGFKRYFSQHDSYNVFQHWFICLFPIYVTLQRLVGWSNCCWPSPAQ